MGAGVVRRRRRQQHRGGHFTLKTISIHETRYRYFDAISFELIMVFRSRAKRGENVEQHNK